MANPPLPISVVLPVYQGMPYLRACVESVLCQKARGFEFIIGDDGSTDGSRAYLDSLRDTRVRVFPGKGRVGLFSHLNRLIRRCRAPLIHFLCQDDLLQPECLGQEIAFFQAHPEIAFSIAKYTVIGETGAVISQPTLGDLPEILSPSLAAQHFFYHGCIAGNLSTVCMRSSALAGTSFNESFRVSGDYELLSRLARQSPIGVLDQRLLQIRQHPRQLSRSKQSAVAFVFESALIRRQILPFLPASARSAALRYERRRHHVLDFHLALRCFFSGRWEDAKQIVGALGIAGTFRALAAWGWTLNNRRRPQAPWVLPQSNPNAPNRT